MIKCIIILGVIATLVKYIKNLPLDKPSRTTFLLIRIINVYFFFESLLQVVIRKLPIYKTQRIEVTQVITYPIKSCKGIRLKSCYIDGYGLKYDRMYMFGVWDGKRFKSITQRECPKLCLCSIEKNGDSFKVSCPESDEFFYLPTEVNEKFLERHSHAEEELVHLWEVEFNTLVLEDVLPKKFLSEMGLPLNSKLLYSPRGKFVKTNVPGPLRNLRSTHFQEYFPLLLMSEEDLLDFKKKLEDDQFPVSFDNFRPNIVVKGVGTPYQIDIWNKITIAGHKWLIISKCPRCTIPNINQKTGEVDPHSTISKQLMKYRRCDPGNQYFMFLGVHGIQIDTNYYLNVGDPIEVHQKLINYYKPLE